MAHEIKTPLLSIHNYIYSLFIISIYKKYISLSRIFFIQIILEGTLGVSARLSINY